MLRVALLAFAFFFLLPACKKPDNNPSGNDPIPTTNRIKTYRITYLEGEDAGKYIEHRFTYNSNGLVDAMQVSAGTLGIVATIQYERYPTYFVRRTYIGSSQTPDNSGSDSLTTDADGRITGRYQQSYGIVLQTLFDYDSARRLREWTLQSSVSPSNPSINTISWSGGDAITVKADEMRSQAWFLGGNYTYDTAVPGQSAHPLTLFALTEWGEPLIRSAHNATGQEGAGRQLLQNITWKYDRIQSYESYGTDLKKIKLEFTYY